MTRGGRNTSHKEAQKAQTEGFDECFLSSLRLFVADSFSYPRLSVFICGRLLRLLNEIFCSGILRGIQDPFRLAEFHYFAAFHVKQLISQSFQETDRMGHYDHRVAARNKSAQQ